MTSKKDGGKIFSKLHIMSGMSVFNLVILSSDTVRAHKSLKNDPMPENKVVKLVIYNYYIYKNL